MNRYSASNRLEEATTLFTNVFHRVNTVLAINPAHQGAKWKRCNEKNSYVRKTNTLKKSKTLSVSPLEPLKHLTVWIYLYGPTSASRIFVRREKVK